MLQDVYVALERAKVQQTGACRRHGHLVLILALVLIILGNQLKDSCVATIDGILDRTHQLFRLRHALKVEVGALIP